MPVNAGAPLNEKVECKRGPPLCSIPSPKEKSYGDGDGESCPSLHKQVCCDGDGYNVFAHRQAGVLYISFHRPQRAKKTIEADDGILIRKDGSSIVGLTILNASSRQ